MTPPQALIIDDEWQICQFISDVLTEEGWKVKEANNAEQAFEMLEKENWHLIFCDVILGEINGYQILKNFIQSGSTGHFILMTGQGSAAGALDATAFGASDYLSKPFSISDIQNIAQTVLEQNRLRAKSEKTGSSQTDSPSYISDIPLIGKSPKFVECLKLVGRVAPTKLPVLITGESGTGKEVVARAIHQRSPRANKPFVPVNCGAIPFELIESELFGHARGAFTGAHAERRGLWEEAEGGTIFLDEITETNLLFQVKLLRTLQENEFRRVGSNHTIKANVRVIAATNRNIEEEVNTGRFRHDLMYRLNAITIHLPPLRERIEDIPLLADFFANRQTTEKQPKIVFSADTLKILQAYNWRGNIRELENTILHATSFGTEIIYPEYLPAHLLKYYSSQKNIHPSVETGDNQTDSSFILNELVTMAEMEEKYVSYVLAQTNGNKQAASRILEIDRKTLVRILNRINKTEGD